MVKVVNQLSAIHMLRVQLVLTRKHLDQPWTGVASLLDRLTATQVTLG